MAVPAEIEIEVEATLTDRYQTTVPEVVRRFLRLGKRDKMRFVIRDGEVLVTSSPRHEENDPVIGSFLHFLACDMQRHPDTIQPLTPELLKRINSLVGDVDVDLDAPLSLEDE